MKIFIKILSEGDPLFISEYNIQVYNTKPLSTLSVYSYLYSVFQGCSLHPLIPLLSFYFASLLPFIHPTLYLSYLSPPVLAPHTFPCYFDFHSLSFNLLHLCVKHWKSHTLLSLCSNFTP